jgi:hypothetical protein
VIEWKLRYRFRPTASCITNLKVSGQWGKLRDDSVACESASACDPPETCSGSLLTPTTGPLSGHALFDEPKSPTNSFRCSISCSTPAAKLETRG